MKSGREQSRGNQFLPNAKTGARLRPAGERRLGQRAGQVFLLAAAILVMACTARAQMDPYFTAINVPAPKGTLMLMLLPDYQLARTGPNFLTYMGMAEYGITNRWTVGFMAEGQKIGGLPATFGGVRFNTYFQILPHDRLLHLTLYGEYEDLNAASLYKMEISGFGGEDLTIPLSLARNTPAHTFEQRLIGYHDWGRLNFTVNFINETNVDSWGNNFGYVWGFFRRPAWSAMDAMNGRAGAKGTAPSGFSFRRLGYGVEMMGGLGNTSQFGFDWPREQQYFGPVFSYSLSPAWSFRLEPTFGLSDVSDRFVLRMGVDYAVPNVFGRLRRAF